MDNDVKKVVNQIVVNVETCEGSYGIYYKYYFEYEGERIYLRPSEYSLSKVATKVLIRGVN